MRGQDRDVRGGAVSAQHPPLQVRSAQSSSRETIQTITVGYVLLRQEHEGWWPCPLNTMGTRSLGPGTDPESCDSLGRGEGEGLSSQRLSGYPPRQAQPPAGGLEQSGCLSRAQSFQ